MTLYNYALNGLGIVVSASSYQAALLPIFAFDGSEVTKWAPMTNYANNWLKVDLGVAQYITQVRLSGQRNFSQPGAWVLQFSDDDVTYYPTSVTFDSMGDQTATFEGLSHRYWRVFMAGGNQNPCGISTLEIVGPIEAPPAPTNPTPDYIAAWLDGLEANYVPSVQDWLEAH